MFSRVNHSIFIFILQSSALYYASEHGSREAALILLDNGAKVNSRNSLWETPLHVACENGKVNE